MNGSTYELRVLHRYLFLPVKNGEEKVVFHLQVNGQGISEFDIELDKTGAPDWWAFYDLSAFHSQSLTLTMISDTVAPDEAGWRSRVIRTGDELLDAGDLYHERYRPQFHFTSRRGWNNDPNGLLYLNGEWHLFYQHNPFGIRWGNMHWGHAVSRDLLHWQELPVALYPRSLHDMAYSGGGFVDWPNHSGQSRSGSPAIVVAFTSTGRGECLASSSDHGRTFTEFPENPVIKHYGRDPKILWYEPESKWVMIVYEELKPHPAAEETMYAIYDSVDLKTWTRRSQLVNHWECPELFSLPLDNNPADLRWVIYGARRETARSMCLVGTFDGAQFITEAENTHAHYGPAFYAAQIFSGAPDQRRIMIGWLAGANYPGMPFSQGMTVPLELSLRTTAVGPRLLFYPVRELESLRTGEAIHGSLLTLAEANQLLSEANSELLDLDLVLDLSGPLTIDLRGHALTITSDRVEFAGCEGRLYTSQSPITVRVLLDRAVTEIFINQGEAAFAAMTLPGEAAAIRLSGTAFVRNLLACPLQAIWP